jgi:ribosomal protein S18 acetylase RimI-like enzyme
MSEQLVIRPFRQADQRDVAELWSDAFGAEDRAWNKPATYIERQQAVRADLFLVGEIEGRVVATVIGGYDGVRGWVYHLAVARELRRHGHGRAMMRALEERFATLGCPKINLQILAHNGEVVRFYETLGYRVEERVSMGKVLAGG